MKVIWIEVLRFLKNNIKYVISGALLFGLILGASSYFLDRGNPSLEVQNGNTLVDGNGKSAIFNFYIENQDGTVYTNTSIIEQYMLMDKTLMELNKFTDTDVYKLFQKELETNYSRTPEDRGVLGVIKNPYSQRMSIVSNTGNEEDNMKIVQYFSKLMKNNQIDFLETKNIYYFEEPMLVDSLDTSNTIIKDEGDDLNITSVTIRVIAGMVLGIVIVIGIVVIKTLFSKKLNYSFSYFWDENDIFFLSDSKLENSEELKQFVNFPIESNKLVVTENSTEAKIQEFLSVSNNDNLKFLNSITEINSLDSIGEVIILIQSNVTSRAWYKKQRRALKLINIPIKIVQINN